MVPALRQRPGQLAQCHEMWNRGAGAVRNTLLVMAFLEILSESIFQ